MAPRCRGYRSRRLQAFQDDPKLLVISPTPPSAGLNELKPINLSTVLMAVHKYCYTALNLSNKAAAAGGILEEGLICARCRGALCFEHLLGWLVEAKLGSDRSLGSCGKQLRQPDQVVGGRGEGEGASDAIGAAQHRPSHTADGLHPAERLFAALADRLARGVAGMACRARVHR